MDTAKVIRKSYKFRIYPTKAQVATLEMTLELCRELYNAALQERRDAWELNRISVHRFEQQKQLPDIRKERPEFESVNMQIFQDVLKRLSRTFDVFFLKLKKGKKSGYPRFKGSNRYKSFTFPQMKDRFRIENNKLHLSKIGKIKIKLSRSISGVIKTCTIKREDDKWFAVFSVETAAEPLPKTGNKVGIDVGIENFATLSNGIQVENFNFRKVNQEKLRIAQRRVSRRKKFSKGWKKAVSQVSKIYAKTRNQRNDFQQKFSTNLVKDFDLIAIEKLQILEMSKGRFKKFTDDVAWGYFFNMLRYKAENADRKLVEIDPRGTSQTCICGETVKKDLSVRLHQCEKCGLSEHRDIVSAKVILQRALGQSVKAIT